MSQINVLPRIATYLFVILLFTMPHAQSAEFFIDTFDDGDIRDGMPAVWSPGLSPGGILEVVNGRFVHESDVNMSTYVDECFEDVDCHYDDMSLRTSFRIESGSFTDVTLFARSLGSPNSTLYGGLDTTGNAILAMSIGAEVVFFERAPTGLDPSSQEIALQFDIVESQLSLWPGPMVRHARSRRMRSPPFPNAFRMTQGQSGSFIVRPERVPSHSIISRRPPYRSPVLRFRCSSSYFPYLRAGVSCNTEIPISIGMEITTHCSPRDRDEL